MGSTEKIIIGLMLAGGVAAFVLYDKKKTAAAKAAALATSQAKATADQAAALAATRAAKPATAGQNQNPIDQLYVSELAFATKILANATTISQGDKVFLNSFFSKDNKVKTLSDGERFGLPIRNVILFNADKLFLTNYGRSPLSIANLDISLPAARQTLQENIDKLTTTTTTSSYDGGYVADRFAESAFQN